MHTVDSWFPEVLWPCSDVESRPKRRGQNSEADVVARTTTRTKPRPSLRGQGRGRPHVRYLWIRTQKRCVVGIVAMCSTKWRLCLQHISGTTTRIYEKYGDLRFDFRFGSKRFEVELGIDIWDTDLNPFVHDLGLALRFDLGPKCYIAYIFHCAFCSYFIVYTSYMMNNEIINNSIFTSNVCRKKGPSGIWTRDLSHPKRESYP